MPKLRVSLPEGGDVTYVLTGDRITVGRRPDNTIQILDRSVSAHHAEFLYVDGHYRLHDLQSTNLTQVEGNQIADYHLHNSCKISFGNVLAEFDAAPNPVEEGGPKMTAAQLEKDMAFMRAENQELINKVETLQRRIDILSSARLVTGKAPQAESTPEEVKKLQVERDELRFQNSGLRLELENLREELLASLKERDQARQLLELAQVEKHNLQEEVRTQDKGATQKIVFAGPSSSPSGAPTAPTAPAPSASARPLPPTGLGTPPTPPSVPGVPATAAH